MLSHRGEEECEMCDPEDELCPICTANAFVEGGGMELVGVLGDLVSLAQEQVPPEINAATQNLSSVTCPLNPLYAAAE